jgi:hypothetical protein
MPKSDTEIPLPGRETWTGLPDLIVDRPKMDMDELRRDYFRFRFPRLGEWIMEESNEDSMRGSPLRMAW